MKLLADMGVSLRVVGWLREQGHDVVHLSDEGLHKLPNGEIFVKGIAEKRTILTFDLDFSEIVALSKGELVSVILFRLRNTTTLNVINRLTNVLSDATAALKKGAVVVVEDSRHRIRSLPIQ